jgi:hypothetical protein
VPAGGVVSPGDVSATWYIVAVRPLTVTVPVGVSVKVGFIVPSVR